jgi:hypothetical protein
MEYKKEIRCPLCGDEVLDVVYMFLPHKLCCNEECNCLFGFWENITKHFPFDGFFVAYEHSYLRALFTYIRLRISKS